MVTLSHKILHLSGQLDVFHIFFPNKSNSPLNYISRKNPGYNCWLALLTRWPISFCIITYHILLLECYFLKPLWIWFDTHNSNHLYLLYHLTYQPQYFCMMSYTKGTTLIINTLTVNHDIILSYPTLLTRQYWHLTHLH